MKEFIYGMMLGSVAAIAFCMTDSGCAFTCKAKKKIACMCKTAEKELCKMQEEAKEKADELHDALTTD